MCHHSWAAGNTLLGFAPFTANPLLFLFICYKNMLIADPSAHSLPRSRSTSSSTSVTLSFLTTSFLTFVCSQNSIKSFSSFSIVQLPSYIGILSYLVFFVSLHAVCSSQCSLSPASSKFGLSYDLSIKQLPGIPHAKIGKAINYLF